MAHNQRFNPDSFYRNGVPLPASFYQGLDTAGTAAINADQGGTWNPGSPIQIGGAGMAFCGPTTTTGGATIVTPLGSGKRIVHAANDATGLASGHRNSIRTLVTSIESSGRVAGPTRWTAGANLGYQDFQYTGPVSASPGNAIVGKRILAPIRVHHGAQFTQATLKWKVLIPRTVLPGVLPKMRIYAVDVFGNIFPLAAPPMPGVSMGGWIQLAAATESPSFYSNVEQILIYNLLPGIVVDAQDFAYMVEIVDETGTASSGFPFPGNLYSILTCSFQGIASMAPQ